MKIKRSDKRKDGFEKKVKDRIFIFFSDMNESILVS